MDLTQLLNNDLGKQIIEGIGTKAGTTKEETNSVINAGLPVLLGMLKNNSTTKEGEGSLQSALAKHDGSIFDNIQGFLGNDNQKDGQGILGHILGNKQKAVEGAISKETGVNTASVSKILILLAPVVMGLVGQKSKSGGNNALGGVLGGLLGGSSSSSLGGSILSSVLSGKGGGLGDILGNATNQKKKGGLGDLLGGLFGK